MRDVVVKGYDGAGPLDAVVLRRIRNEHTMGRRVRELHEHFTVALLDKRGLGSARSTRSLQKPISVKMRNVSPLRSSHVTSLRAASG